MYNLLTKTGVLPFQYETNLFQAENGSVLKLEYSCFKKEVGPFKKSTMVSNKKWSHFDMEVLPISNKKWSHNRTGPVSTRMGPTSYLFCF